MKRLIVSDKNGRIIATGPHPAEYPNATLQGKAGFGISALKGQKVHEIELPAHINTIEDIRALHTTHQIKVKAGKSQLIAKRRGTPRLK